MQLLETLDEKLLPGTWNKSEEVEGISLNIEDKDPAWKDTVLREATENIKEKVS